MATSGENKHFQVHLGTWTNWSRGRILGATLTLEPRYGLLLLSFTATFVGFVASRSWRIVSLILHRIYSTPEPRDALHHQRQVVLRNSVSAVSTLWTTLQLVWCWRAIASGILARTLPIIIYATLGICAFTIAGGFTSSIASGIGNEVLIDGSRCGVLDVGSLSDYSLSVIYPWMSQSKKNAANYAQQCYTFNSTGTLECNTFVKSRLQFTSNLNAPCPFSDSICRSIDSNLLLDSGLLSSDDFGLNLPVSQRMFYRQVLHCAPLRTTGHTTNVSTRYTDYTRYHYGRRDNFFYSDWTFEAESIRMNYLRRNNRDNRQRWGGSNGFDLMSIMANTANGTVWANTSEFIPIPQLIVPDADLALVFLTPDGSVFMNQTDDPWYRGKVQLYDAASTSTGGRRTVYISDEAASPMGCAVRHQYCNYNKKCSSLASFADALSSAMNLFYISPEEVNSGKVPSEEQNATMSRFEMFQASIIYSSAFHGLINGLGPSSLQSLEHFFEGMMGPIPDNQWQLDAIYWFEIILASIQASYVNTARGPTDEAVLPYTVRPQNEHHWQMCNNQKILSTDYTSLSLFGLYFTYVTGLLIILASYAGEPLLELLYSRSKYKEYKYLEWAANGTLQLQRLAYQGLGSEKWTNYTDDIPKTRPGYFLADLARAYPTEDNSDEMQETKAAAHAASTTTAPSVSNASTNQSVSEQPLTALAQTTSNSAAPRPPQLAVPHSWKAFPPIPQPASPSPQAATPSLQAVSPNPQAVSPVSQNVSPVSQSGAV